VCDDSFCQTVRVGLAAALDGAISQGTFSAAIIRQNRQKDNTPFSKSLKLATMPSITHSQALSLVSRLPVVLHRLAPFAVLGRVQHEVGSQHDAGGLRGVNVHL
jgi:hypothetical protein